MKNEAHHTQTRTRSTATETAAAAATQRATVASAAMASAARAETDLASLYEAHAARVARWATRLAGAEIDPEDVVQEVFLVVQRRLGEWRGDAKISTWLYRITEHVVHRQLRQQRLRRWARGLSDDFASELPVERRTPDDELESKQAARTVYTALDGLDQKQREVLILFEIEGLSGEEISALTGTKIATVWVRLHRGRGRFLDRLREMSDGDQRAA